MFENHIFKFRSWSNDLHKRLLTHNEIYFSAAKSFNDPFDCQISFNYHGLTKKDFLQLIEKYLRNGESGLNEKEIELIAKEYEITKNLKDNEYLERHENQRKEYYLNKIGICSFAGNCDNIVMWSHYACSHKGICFCFDFDKLRNFIKPLYKSKNLALDLHEIKYSKEYPVILIRDFSEIEEEMVTPIITKSDKWAYEDEYRLFLSNEVDRSIQLNGGIITSIILGCKIPLEDKNEIFEIIDKENKAIEVYEAKMKRNEFGLDFGRIK